MTKKEEIRELKEGFGFGSDFGWNRVLDRIKNDGDKKVFITKVVDKEKTSKFYIYIIAKNQTNAYNKCIRSSRYKGLKNRYPKHRIKKSKIKFLAKIKDLDQAEVYEFGSTDIAVLT